MCFASTGCPRDRADLTLCPGLRRPRLPRGYRPQILHPSPYTLHHTSYNVHPTPPTPYILQRTPHTPHTTHHTPHTTHHTPHPNHQPRNPKPETSNPQPRTPHRRSGVHPLTLNIEPHSQTHRRLNVKPPPLAPRSTPQVFYS